MDILIARLLHILAGVIWAGSVITFVRQIEPAINESGAGGQAFMQSLLRRGYSNYMTVVAGTGILSGLYLYWRLSDGFSPAWIGSSFGITITIGALTAIAAFALGPLFYLPSGKRIEAITRGIGPEGPSAEQRAEITAITHHLERVGNWSMAFLGITVLAMAGARYVGSVLP